MDNSKSYEYSTKIINKVSYDFTEVKSGFGEFLDNKKVRLTRKTCTDQVIVEQPLQITLFWMAEGVQQNKIFTITMRTPGDDYLLIIGLLHSEGVIKQLNDIETVTLEEQGNQGEGWQNEWLVHFKLGFTPDLASLERYQITYSSCGLCGTTSLKALQLKTQMHLSYPEHNKALPAKSLVLLSNKMRNEQRLFDETGGVHGAALFHQKVDQQLNLQHIYEDIGRHNAVDKVIGGLLESKRSTNSTPSNATLSNATLINKADDLVSQHQPLYLLLVSGRISFEIVQKAIMAGISILVAVGAPSDLAIQAAKQFDITLIGFVSEQGFNVYHGDWRINNK